MRFLQYGFSFHIMFLSDHNNTTIEVKLVLLYVTSYWLGKLFFQVRNLYSCVKVAEDFVSPEVSDLQAFLLFSQHRAWLYYAGKMRSIAFIK